MLARQCLPDSRHCCEVLEEVLAAAGALLKQAVLTATRALSATPVASKNGALNLWVSGSGSRFRGRGPKLKGVSLIIIRITFHTQATHNSIPKLLTMMFMMISGHPSCCTG